MEVLDNISKLLGDDLKGTVRPGAKVRIAASSFSIYAFEALRRELENVWVMHLTEAQFFFKKVTNVQSRSKIHELLMFDFKNITILIEALRLYR